MTGASRRQESLAEGPAFPSRFDAAFLRGCTAELLYREESYTLHRIRDPGSGMFWRIKTAAWHAAQACRRLENSFEIGQRLDPAWTSTPRALLRTIDGLVAVYHDGGAGLGQRTALETLPLTVPLDRFLDFASRAAAALAHVHARGVLHRDIRRHCVVERADGSVRIAGFGEAVMADPVAGIALEGLVGDLSLPFAAPEVARRSNPHADCRSDLYSLGVVLYQLLTGRLPFDAQTPADWLYAHVAMHPIPPGELREMPVMLDRILLKLLAKEPGERYQTAASLHADLDQCRTQWAGAGRIEAFAPAQGPQPPFTLPNELFGRDAEIELLHDLLSRVRRSRASELVLVSAPPGGGKSALVGALRLDAQHGAFVSAKSEQHRQDTPFGPFADVLRLLIGGLLAAGPTVLAEARKRLLNGLAGHGSLVADLVPALDLVLGATPRLPEVPIGQAKRRIGSALLRALACFAHDDRPLVVFLDDLQWMDTSSWDTLELLATEPQRNILLIGAYRSAGSAALSARLRAVRQAFGPATAQRTDIELRPLTVAEVSCLIATATRQDGAACGSLAQAVHDKTAGNPFHVRQLLRAMADEQVFRFDGGSAGSREARWVWDAGEVLRFRTSDNVVDLVLCQLGRLPRRAQEMLFTLACIGTTAGSGMLADLLDITEHELALRAQTLRDRGLLVRDPARYSFAHDRILEAAHSLSTPAQRGRLHRRIANLLIRQDSEAAFVIAGHVEQADTEGLSTAERTAFRAALLAAARRAKGAAAVTQALDYLRGIDGLLGGDAWVADHALAVQACSLRCECQIINLDLDDALDGTDLLLAHARTAIDRAQAYQLRAAIQTLRSDYNAAITAVLTGLDALGISLERTPSRQMSEQAYHAVRQALGNRPISAIAAFPVAHDPRIAAAMGLLGNCQASFFVNDGISFLHLAKIVQLTLESGPTPASAYGLAWFGVYIAHHFDAHADGLAYAEAALALVERHGWDVARTATLVAIDQVSVWTRPLGFALQNARQAALVGARFGDVGMSCYACNHIVSDILFMGVPLPKVLDEAERFIQMVRQVGFKDIERLIRSQIDFAQRLRTGPIEAGTGGRIDFAELGDLGVSQPTLFWEWLYAGMMHYFYGDLATAAEYFKILGGLTWALPAHINLVDYHLFAALTEAQLGGGNGELDAHRAQLAAWAAMNPATFDNKRLLIDGEIARRDGRDLAALQCYEAAAGAANAAGFLHEQAIAHERAAACCEASRLDTAARHHLRTARDCFLRWGADGKVRQLEQRHPFLQAETPSEPASSGQAALDIASWAEAAQAFSEEIILDRLIEKLLSIMMVHAGARSAILIRMQDGMPVIEASGRVADRQTVVEADARIPSDADLPLVMLNRVIQTRRTIAHDEPPAVGEGGRPQRGGGARSTICLPLIKQGQLMGVLYLENDLARGVFTAGRTAMLDLLAPQAAIALDAARLYADLLEENGRRRQTEAALHKARTELARVTHLTIMGGLAASLAHEINQPLTAISSNAGAGLRWLKRSPPDLDQATASFTAIQHSARHAADVVRALRSLAKQAPTALTEVSVDSLVREVLSLTLVEIEARSVVVHSRLNGGNVNADRTQLQQVVLNIVMNATEALAAVPPGSRRLSVVSETAGDRVVVRIHDSGCGIKPEVQARIFDPFFTTKESGMGMGLAICRTIMEAHGGSLKAASIPGEGTTFTVSLPKMGLP